MEFSNRTFRKEPAHYPDKIILLGPFDLSLSNEFIEYKLKMPVLKDGMNNNGLSLSPERGIYVLKEFENNPDMDILEHTPNTWVFGPTALLEYATDTNLEFRTKPIYCTSMFGLCFYINCPNDIPLMKRLVRMIKWMGGMFKKQPCYQVTHMITDTVLASGYRYCFTFQVPVLNPQWVEHCWQQRHRAHYKATSDQENFKIQTFEGLYLSFYGFPESVLIEVKEITSRNGGNVVSYTDPICTHLIVYDILDEESIDVPENIPYVVHSNWFWSSLEQHCRNYEEYFTISINIKSQTLNESKWVEAEDALQDSTEQKPNYFTMTVKKPSLRNKENMATLELQDSQRKYVFEELCNTETHYVQSLKDLINIKLIALNECIPNGPFISQAEAKIIFGNIESILEIHEKLNQELRSLMENWESNIGIGQSFIKLGRDMLKEYVTFSKMVEEGQEAFQKCQNENQNFREIVRLNTRPNIGQPKDLYIRPIQRLCSVALLLSAIKKHTRDDNDDKSALTKAIDVVSKVCQAMNQDRTKVEKAKHLFGIHNLIEQCPADLVTHHREFICKFSAQEVTNKRNCLGVHVMFFLFNDILEVTKIRSKAQASKKGDTAKNSSIIKPYKHIAMLSLSMVVNILRFEGNSKPTFGFSIRDLTNENKTTINTFQYLEKDGKLDEILLLIGKILSERDCSKSAADYIIKRIPAGRLSIHPIMPSSTSNIMPAGKVVQACKNLFGVKKQSKPLRRSASCSELIGLFM